MTLLPLYEATMFEPQTPQEQTFTYWKNPTQDKVRADVCVGPGAGPTGKRRYTWEPGETKPVPSEFDNEIRHDRGAGIVCGLAPQLVNMGKGGVGAPPPMPAPAPAADSSEPKRGRNLPPDLGAKA